MKRFDYEITVHPASEFTRLVYFCGAQGECNLEEVPMDQVTKLSEILNARGNEGWELVSLSYGKNGLLAFWKREAPAEVVEPA